MAGKLFITLRISVDRDRNSAVFSYVTHDCVAYGDDHYLKYRAGFHATLYKHKETGQIRLAIAGTDFGNKNRGFLLQLYE